MRWLGVGSWLFAVSLAACGGSGGDEDDAGARCTNAASCDDGVYCNGTESCAPEDPAADDRGCLPGEAPCTEGQPCSEERRSCEGGCVDPDADGDDHDARECGGDDCDDTDANRYPGNTEVCDAEDRDEDCDPRTFGFRDLDMDGSPDALCCNGDNCGDDCDDMRPGVSPDNTETCNGRDDDCDGNTDEGVQRVFFADADGDGFGDSESAPVMACTPPEGTSETGGDCDDTNPNAHDADAPEVCDAADNDCDGVVDEGAIAVDWWVDADGDMFGDPSSTPVSSCVPVPDRATNDRDCDDGNSSRNPAVPENCNGIDDDCDAAIDEELVLTCWTDADGDGHAPADASSVEACTCPPFTTQRPPTTSTDCDDDDDTIHPGAPEVCDRWDNDCSDGPGRQAVPEEDRDGDGHTSPSYAGCTNGFPKDDCHDRLASVHPGVTAYFTSPRCPNGTKTCNRCPGRCYAESVTCIPDSGLCDVNPSVPPSSYDYNCSGVEERQAPVTCSASSCAMGATCAPGGPSYTGMPACGSNVTVVRCTCVDMVSGICGELGMSISAPLGCH